MNRTLALCIAVFAVVLACSPRSWAATSCTASDFGEVVDQTAQALRDLNASGAQRFQAKLQEFQKKYGLSDEEIKLRAASLQDEKMTDFNREIDSLVTQMDLLSQTPSEQINCDKLDELKRARDRLLTVMGQKSGYMLARADVELDRPLSEGVSGTPNASISEAVPDRSGKNDRLAAASPEPRQENATSPDASPASALDTASEAAPQNRPDAVVDPGLPERRPDEIPAESSWLTENQGIPSDADDSSRIASAERTEERLDAPVSLAPPPDGGATLPPPSDAEALRPQVGPSAQTYSIEEISEAGRGVFGTVTAQFAAAINYAFQNYGYPNAYIVGSEGGAALLAGLRFGKGMLHSKTEPMRTIYWQSPSVGFDLGAEGSSALFLVYNLDNTEKLYGRFTGIGGSAYVAGGIGLNVLGKDGVIIAPIRTGIGLRLGANLAYLKFTERQTWNPF